MVINVSPIPTRRKEYGAGRPPFGMVYADLHVHTTNSDGSLSLGAVPAAARAAGVSVVGVTDHDRLHPDLEAPLTEREGVRLIQGIELRTETPTQRIDLLGYGLNPTAALRAETDRLGTDRKIRGRKIISCLERELGIDLPLSVTERTGRPHIARAVVSHPETGYESVEAVFQDRIGSGRPCFVAREVPAFERAVELLQDAAEVVSLAHPFRYPDPEAALDHCGALDAVERYYPYDRPASAEPVVDTDLIESTIEEHDLLETGGSDAHGDEIGTTGLDRESYRGLGAAISPQP